MLIKETKANPWLMVRRDIRFSDKLKAEVAPDAINGEKKANELVLNKDHQSLVVRTPPQVYFQNSQIRRAAYAIRSKGPLPQDTLNSTKSGLDIGFH